MHAEPQAEHKWLDRLVGEWAYEAEMSMGPDQPTEKTTGTESVRSLGGLWVLCEAKGSMPGGGTGHTLMTVGYDPVKKAYVGSFVGSMMAMQWLYENGSLDESGTVLTLNSEGPSFTGDGTTWKYQDRIEVTGDRRVMRSLYPAADGSWQEFMTITYRRVG